MNAIVLVMTKLTFDSGIYCLQAEQKISAPRAKSLDAKQFIGNISCILGFYSSFFYEISA